MFAYPLKWALLAVCVLLMSSCLYQGGERGKYEVRKLDGTPVTCVEPPPEVVKKASVATDIDASAKEIGALAKASVRGEVSPERIREKLPTNVAAFEVIDFRLCMAYANGLYSPQEYRAFMEAKSGLPSEESRKQLQLVIRKFEQISLVDGKPILVNVVVNNLTSDAMAVKSYDVTAILESLADAEEEMRREDELFNSLTKAMKEVKAISNDIPPSPPSIFLTLKGPVLPSDGKEQLKRGKLTFYFLGALVHSGGATFYCNHTQGDGIFRLCRKHNSAS